MAKIARFTNFSSVWIFVKVLGLLFYSTIDMFNAEDINECSEMPDICGPYARSCSNINGSYICHCRNGNNITATACTSDINECVDNPGICGPHSRSCSNTEGGYICHCLNGNKITNSPCSSDVLLDHYLGCFYNNATEWENATPKHILTFERCIEYCTNSSKTYASIKNGLFCECFDESGLQLHDSICNETCGENSIQYCGGIIHGLFPTYTLYSVCPFGTYGQQCKKACHCERQSPCNRKTGKCPNGCHGNYIGPACDKLNSFYEQYIGCYKDGNDGDRAMPHKAADDWRSMSLQLCTNRCSYNYSFSGPQNRQQCFCGDSYDRHGRLNEANCNMSCSGNKKEICGGGNALSVYHSCPSGNYGRNCAKVCNCEKGRCFFHSGKCQIDGCKPGWTGNTCVIRDCSVNNGDCNEGELCTAVQPIISRTISVCRCPDGYGRLTMGANCSDLDECLYFPGICGPYALSCSNTEGSYICHCRNGNNVIGSNCTSDVNECMENPDICGPYALSCINIEGSYVCLCQNGINAISSVCQKPDENERQNSGCFSIAAVIVPPLVSGVVIVIMGAMLYFQRSRKSGGEKSVDNALFRKSRKSGKEKSDDKAKRMTPQMSPDTKNTDNPESEETQYAGLGNKSADENRVYASLSVEDYVDPDKIVSRP